MILYITEIMYDIIIILRCASEVLECNMLRYLATKERVIHEYADYQINPRKFNCGTIFTCIIPIENRQK